MPYTYVLKHKNKALYYYGVRFKKNCEPDELGKTYFSSSKKVHEIIETEGAGCFHYRITRIFERAVDAVRWETKFLRKVKAIKNPKWLNQSVNPFESNQIFSDDVILARTKKMIETRKASNWKAKKPTVTQKRLDSRKRHGLLTKGKTKKTPNEEETANIQKILMLYKSRPDVSDVIDAGKTKLGKWKCGIPRTYDRAFSIKYHSTINVSDVGCQNIITNRSLVWKELYEKIMQA